MRSLILGIGGGGCNLAKSLGSELGLHVAVANTDEKALAETGVMARLLLDRRLLRSGVLSSHELLQEAMTIRLRRELKALSQGYQQVLLVAGFGGKSGARALPLLTKQLVAIRKRVLTVAIIPFAFESKRREAALSAVAHFHAAVDKDHVLVVDNQALLQDASLAKKDVLQAFQIQAHRVAEQLREGMLKGVEV